MAMLKNTIQLGVVSNIWARKKPWLEEFKRAGVDDIWSAIVFSSDGPCIKPALPMFEQALTQFNVPHDKVVFIGDSLRVDIEPAKNLGIATVWLNSEAKEHPMADYVVSSLLDLEMLEATPI